MKIQHRITGETIFDSPHETMWETIEAANLKGANLEGANLEGANLPILDTIQKMPMRSLICAEVCAAPEKLEMATWHTCDTVHCIAGWAIVLHPKGKELESRIGTSAAAALILWKCESEIPDFNSSNEEAMEWLRKGQ